MGVVGDGDGGVDVSEANSRGLPREGGGMVRTAAGVGTGTDVDGLDDGFGDTSHTTASRPFTFSGVRL